MRKTGSLILFLVLLIPCAGLHAQWYVSYESGLAAFKSGHWDQAVKHFTEALDDESSSKARKRTYSMQFIDYFPYLYRGIAYYKLNDMANARADLEKAKSEAVIDDAEEPGKLLTQYLDLVEQKPPPATAQKKTVQNPPAAVTPPVDQKKADALALQKQKKDQAAGEFAAGVEYFKDGDFDKAEEKFKSVLALDGGNADARGYLKRIPARRKELAAAAATPPVETHPKEVPSPPKAQPAKVDVTPPADTSGSALFREAVALFNDGKYVQAKARFQNLQGRAALFPELPKYVQSIESVEKKAREGIAAFFEGEYREAIEQLSASSRNGSDNPHVYAFLACSYAAEYLLSGGEDGAMKKDAVAAYGRTRGIDPRYEFDDKLISPRIIALLRGN